MKKNGIKTAFQSLCIACSMYSRIPVPGTVWTEAGMKYALCFFPVVGAVIGAAMAVLDRLSTALDILPGSIAYTLFGTAIPLLITGGIHMDGFLDTVDARSSFQDRERKLEILKDPHTGAFAIIGCSVYLILYAACFSLMDHRAFPAIAGIYVMTRAVSGWSVVTFPKAKKDGLASTFAAGAETRTVQKALAGWFILGVIFVCMTADAGTAAALTLTVIATAYWYYRMAMREFGGMTGDLAGYFLQVAELSMTAVLAVSLRIF